VAAFTYEQHRVEIDLLDLGDAWSIRVMISNPEGTLVKAVSLEREVKFATRETAERQATAWARRWIDRSLGREPGRERAGE
jgi:hypothetical protein